MNEEPGIRMKAPMLVVSVCLSLLLWVYVQISQPQGTQTTFVDIGTLGADQFADHYILPESLGTAQVRIDGPQDQLDDAKALDRVLKSCRLSVFVDLTGATVGNNLYPLHIQFLKSQGFKFTLVQKSVLVDIQRLVKRTLPVTIDPTGQIPEEFNLAYNGATSTPGTITIQGSASAVNQVKRIRVLLDLSHITDKDLFGSPEPLDEGDRPVPSVDVTPEVVKLLASVAPASQSQTVLIQPLMKGHPALGFAVTDFSLEPNQVALQGTPEVLAKLKTITTKPINIDGLRASATFEIPLELPVGVKSYSVRSVRVHVTVEPSDTTPATNTASTSP